MGERQNQEPLVSEEFKRRISVGMRRHWDNPEAAARHRAAVSKPQSEETRAKKSAAAKAMWERRRAAKEAREEPPAGR
jgi:hypothetical protein